MTVTAAHLRCGKCDRLLCEGDCDGVYIEKDMASGFGWFVKSNGWSQCYCFTRWGARRAAKRILRKQLLGQQPAVRERVTL